VRRRKETLVLSKLLVVCRLENFSFQNVIRDYDVLDTYQVSFLTSRISSSPIESVQKETLFPIFGSLAKPGEGGHFRYRRPSCARMVKLHSEINNIDRGRKHGQDPLWPFLVAVAKLKG
jgi:hypothetical protein